MTNLKFKTTVVTTAATATTTDALAIFVEQNFSFSTLASLAAAYQPMLEKALEKQKFIGKANSMAVVTGFTNGNAIHLVFIGLGEKKGQTPLSLDRYRRALGSLARTVEARKDSSVALVLPRAELFGIDVQEVARQTTLLLHMAFYHFDEFITDPDRRLKDISSVILLCQEQDQKAVQDGVDKATIIAESVNMCRHWIDCPPEHATPEVVAHHAKEIAKEGNLKYTVFNEKEVCAMGMGGLCAVAKGSDRDAQLVIIEYSCGKKDAPTVAFVGKGITFDSGGLSLKPPVPMETMKTDMSGAAAVIATMKALAQLKPTINVIGITPLSENLPSGKATKPGDIARFYNGKTAEIKNTDAEGRLILADALSYATKHYKLDAIIDIATLTGACAAALGPYFTGMMSKNDALVQRLEKASLVAGDRLWRLPLADDYKPAIKSAVADMANIGSQSYMAGAITAALFLQNFVESDVPWVHLDIAGTAFNVPDMPYYRSEGATGVGVRLLIEVAMQWQN